MDAADAAMTASGEAATAATDAMAAVANLATMQTGATAAGLAYEAHTAAGKAMAAYMHAKAASEAAAEAEVVTAAVEDRIMAEEASANAVMYAMTATEKAGEAETAAMAELMIIDKDKNVGGTSVNADAGSSVITTDGETVTTGRIETMDPMTTGAGVPEGVPFDAMAAPAADTAYKQQVAARELTIGRTIDTSDDTARLMLVTHYAGTKMVSVYRLGTGMPTGTKAGYLSIGDDEDDVNNVALKSEGTYYRAGEGEDTGDLTAAVVVASDAEAVEVFSYVNPNDDEKTYVVLTNEDKVVATGVTKYTYASVDVTAVASDAITDGIADPLGVQVRAALPDATEYKHIHFGVWAALGAPAKSGLQELSDLGIGFVQSIGDGLSGADMPNNGGGTYSGNWAAAVQAEDEDGDGDISLMHGAAGLVADFSKAEITATLTGLATLEGTIDTNTFTGTKATVIAEDTDDPHGLDMAGKFTGTFSGGFYGTKAAEAGGVFDFTSEDAEAGAFRGAFGGDRK